MKGIFLKSLLIIFVLLTLFLRINCEKSFSEEKSKKNTKLLYNINDKKQQKKKRKLNDDDEEDITMEFSDLELINLSIYFDLNNFEEKFPYDKEKYLNLFERAMNKSKDILEDLIRIRKIDDADLTDFSLSDFGTWNIEKWNTEIFGETDNESGTSGKEINLDEINYFVFFNFDSLEYPASSEIVFTLDYYWNEIPLMGVITINENLPESKLSLEYLTVLMLQNMIRLLGFHTSNYEYESSCIVQYDSGKYYIDKESNPNVFSYAKEYFDCSKINKIIFEVDEKKNIYWPSRLFLGDIMSNLDYQEEVVISGFTIAFLKDLGFIEIKNDYTGGLMRFGKHKGCKFFKTKCGNSTAYRNTDDSDEDDEDADQLDSSIIFSNEFYLPDNADNYPEPSCSSGRLSKTVYQLKEITSADDSICEYKLDDNNNNKAYAGSESTNYCPIAEFDTSQSQFVTGSCSSTSISPEDVYDEEFGKDSFCALRALEDDDRSSIKAICYKMICSSLSLTIKVGNNYYVCPRSGGKIRLINETSGYLLCPDYNLICTGTVLCNNLSNCIESKSEEKSNAFDYSNYGSNTILTTQNYDVYNSQAAIYGWELSNDGFCSKYCMYCDSNKICLKCKANYKIDEEDNKACVEKVPYCSNYVNEECTNCDTDYILVQDIQDDPFICVHKDNEKYYYPLGGGGTKFKKCDNDGIENCLECTVNTACEKCKNELVLVDDGTICGDLTTNEYFLDIDDKYKSCFHYEENQNCKKCRMVEGNYQCLECQEGYAFFSDEENTNLCLFISTKGEDKYYTDDEITYIPCSESLDNCIRCEGKNKCIECKENYQIEERNICISQEDIDNELYYSDSDQEGKYVSCSKILITNCQKCTSNSICTGCNNENYVPVDGGTICGEKNSQLYYLDSGEGTYKSCIKYALMPNCLKCEFNTIFNCLECDENYAFVHENDGTVTCTEITSLSTNKYFTSDNKNYYPCDSYQHDINNCDTCNTKDKCLTCKTGFTTANGNTKCIPDSDISEKKYYEDPDNSNYYYLCSTSLSNCITCQNKDECLSCETEYIIEEASNHCISKTLYDEKKYYYNEAGKYVSCSNISGCEKCISATKCILCSSNLFLVKEDENIDSLTCKDTNENQYYQVTEDDITFYKKCTISSNQFCEKCELVDGNYVCLECKEGYAFFFDGSGENVCESKEARADINNYYSTDNQNYYPCNNRQYNVIDNCIKCSNKETCDECNSGYTLVNGNQLCLLNTDISNKKYYQDSEKNDYYFPCSESLEHCDICEDKSTCTTCETDYIIEEASNHCISKTLYDEKKYYKNEGNGKYVSCSNISGCEKCISATKCISCSSNLFLVKEDENIDSLTCKDINENQYYQVTEDDITFYKKCMSHCEECTALDHCTKCEDNYVIIEDDDHTVCEDLSTQKYYYDTQTTKYKLCSTYSNTCQKCQMDDDNNFICLECISTDYAFKHADDVVCSLKSDLKEDNTFYTNDTEINYYSCSIFNNAKNCLKCSNKEICDECQETYQLVNDKKLCVLPTDEENNLVYKDPNTNYLVYCSDSISECNKCQNGETCDECKENSALVDSSKCLPEEEVTNNEHYFKDETTNGYISCSIINNCITCASSTVCTSCAQGYNINNNICQKIGDDDDDDNSLSTGGIIGIVFGCLGFLLLVLLTIYFFMKKILKKNNPTVEIIDNEKQTVKINESEKPNDVETEKKDDIAEIDKVNENEVNIHKGKRSIHN